MADWTKSRMIKLRKQNNFSDLFGLGESKMLYNLYEIASLYNISERTLRRKIDEYNASSSDSIIEPQRKGNKTALSVEDIKRLVKFMGFDYESVRQILELKKNLSDKCQTSDELAENKEDNLDKKNNLSDNDGQYSDRSRTKNNADSDKSQTQNGQMSDKSDLLSDKNLTNIDDILELLKAQIRMKDDQLAAKDQIIKQQNTIIMATQKNMNDLLQHHNELQFSHAKKEDLIKQLEFDRSKTESTVKSISKLERMIDDALLTKRLKDGIDFSKELLKDRKKQETFS